jgi:stage V sporulation protein AD
MVIGKQSIQFDTPVSILGYGSVVGKKEGEGPLAKLFDHIYEDSYIGGTTWEEGEANLQKEAAAVALSKTGISKNEIRYIFSGDLLNQLIATSFGLMDYNIPVFGLYGACSTMGEALSLGSMTVSGGFADYVLAMSSSHFGSAEKTFRFPLEYGNQRPFSATWTVTGSGCVVLGKEKGIARITGITTGKIVDYGVKDSMNMGACMAPAAADVIAAHLADYGSKPDDYDKIITGDLGYIGQTILIDLLEKKGIHIKNQHEDCGILIYDKDKQDTHAGGSGCGCSAVTLCSYILKKIEKKQWKKILFIPTGALLSTISFNEGKSVPGVAHCVVIEAV